MIKYSFIVPVYNTKKYLKKCLNSLVKQTYKDFEIIVINDGSTDNSMDIINDYSKKYKNIKVINQKNQGLSMARNNGVKEAKGKYILFIDSDDYVNADLLENIDKEINDVDVLRYQVVTETDKYKEISKYKEKPFDETNGIDAFKKIVNYHFVEPAWCYVYKKTYYINNKYEFKKDAYHEDFGLIPYVIYNAKSVKSINYIGYHYIIREGSIINSNDYSKTYKKVYDILEHYKNIKKKVKYINNNYLLSFYANSAIIKGKELNKKDRKKYNKELKDMNVLDDVLNDTFVRKLKKLYLRIIL